MIREAPKIFELHRNIGRAYTRAEKTGVLFTRNPIRAANHYLQALRYRSLKLSPGVWTDQERLSLTEDAGEQNDAGRYIDAARNLARLENELTDTRRRLFAAEDNNVKSLRDPGNNEPMTSNNRKTIQDLEKKVRAARDDLARETAVYEGYAKKYDRESAALLREFSGVILDIENIQRDKEKILKEREYHRTPHNFAFNQNWPLESLRESYINLLELASLLDPENPETLSRLGDEYVRAGADYDATLAAIQGVISGYPGLNYKIQTYGAAYS